MALLNRHQPRQTPDSFSDALAAIYDERFDEFYSVATAITRDRASAQDVVQEAFASALRAAHQNRHRGDLSAWIWRIVVNTAHDFARRGRRLQPELSGAPPDTYAGSETASRDVADLAEAIQALPERQRLAIFLRYYADLDYRQIAEVLGTAPGTISAALVAAHRNLKRQLPEVSHD